MVNSSLAGVWEIGWGVNVTTQQAVDCAINLAEAGLREYGVTDPAELSPRKRVNLFIRVNRTLEALGIKEIAKDWWVDHDWAEIDEFPQPARIVVA